MARQFIPALSGIRAIAALAVLVAHGAAAGMLPAGLARIGTPGVMLFFTLSGFLMGHLYLTRDVSRDSILAYLVARFARVYPLFAVTILLSVPVYYFDAEFYFKMDFEGVVRHLLLMGDGLTLWSISPEFQFYGLFILLWLLHRLCPRSPDLRIGGVVMAAIVLLALADYPGGKIAISHYAHFFLSGVIASVLYRNAPTKISYAAQIAFPVLLAVYLTSWTAPVMVLSGMHPDLYGAMPMAILCAGIVLCGASAKAGPTAWMLSSRLLLWLGEISFGIYLLHRFAMYLWLEVADLPGPLTFVLVTITTIISARCAHRWIESPARKLLQFGRRPSARSASPSQNSLLQLAR